VLEPLTEVEEYLRFGPEREKLTFHPALIEQFASVPEGQHQAFVTELIAAEAEPSVKFINSSVRTDSKVAAPRGTVFDALDALEKIAKLPAHFDFSTGYLQENIETATRQDLSNLGLLTASSGRTIDTVNPFGSSASEALLYSCTQTIWFVFAANTVKEHGIRTSSAIIGAAVSDEFDLKWGSASRQRNGQNIKKWVAVLFPLFADLSLQHPDYYYAKSLKAKSLGKGSNLILTEDFLEEIEFQRLQGKTYKAIGDHYGLSQMAITRAKSERPEVIKRAKEQARQRFSKSKSE
jgi:hypothetical protein